MMKFKLIATAALVTFAAVGSASAADLGAPAPNYYKAPPPPPPVYTFTGCYIAGGGGYGFWTQDSFTRLNATGTQLSSNVTNGGKGWFGMGQGGCDYEFNMPLPLFGWSPRLVIGAFGDWDGGQLDGTNSTPSPFGTAVGNERNSSAWFAGGRLGYVVNPRFMTYVSGGWTQARFDQVNYNSIGVPQAPLGFSLAATTYNGWFIGSGFEYSLDILPISGLFLKTEFRYSQYGGNSGTSVPFIFTANGAPTPFNLNSQKSIEMISTELVWRFNFFR